MQDCSGAVFHKAGEPLVIEQFEVPRNLEPGAALCSVRMSTICGSDLHTIGGRRKEPTPIILGHEIIGDVVALGADLNRDWFGNPLNVGDRVTWSIMASCGDCFYCSRHLPQKCERLRKYGHLSCSEWPHLTGGYAQYICLFPGTAIFKIPETVSDEIATPANCALSTVINAAEAIGLHDGEIILIQGAGLLGINLAALAVDAGAEKIFMTDVNPRRLELAEEFGADHCINVGDLADEDFLSIIRDNTGGHGVDVAFEVCGAVAAFGMAIQALRIGGRYLMAGMVSPGSNFDMDGNQLTRKCLTIKGVHNYRPEHLGRAIRFLEEHTGQLPYDRLVGHKFALTEINDAVKTAASGQYIRVAISPHPAL